MNITELTEHQIRNWPAERVKVFVDSGEYDPLDLSPLQTEVKELGACDYRSNCERYAVLRFRSIDELIVSMSHERKLFEDKKRRKIRISIFFKKAQGSPPPLLRNAMHE